MVFAKKPCASVFFFTRRQELSLVVGDLVDGTVVNLNNKGVWAALRQVASLKRSFLRIDLVIVRMCVDGG